MKGGAANANANANAKQLQRQLQFTKKKQEQKQPLKKGSLVEVSSDEEGFKGAWYVATLLQLPSPSRLGGSASDYRKRKIPDHNHRHQAYVEYHSLLAQEGSSEPLREYVNAEFLRPLPPADSFPGPFELGDVVDAYFRDGWWTGVITGVILQGLRFVVTFQNPPDEIDFGISELRFHREWVNRKWVRPAKQRATGLMFSVGKRVEVSFDQEDCRDAWFPATILEDIGNDHFLVEYESPIKGGDAECMKITVDLLHVRPCPPRLKDNVFSLLEKVDASFDFGWWSGVITKELADCRYIVYFKSTNKEREFNHTELRPHMEWKDGNWFTSSQDILRSTDYQKHQGHVYNNVNNTGITVSHSNTGFKQKNAKEKPTLSLNLNQVDPSPCNEEPPRGTISPMDRTQDSPSLSDDKEIFKEETPTVTLSPTVGNPISNDSIVSVDKTKVYDYASPSPENTENNLSNQYLDGDPSDSHTWGKGVKRKRIKLYEEDTSGSGKTSGSSRKLLVKSFSNSVGGREGDALGDAAEAVRKECIPMQTNLPVILGLECDKGSNSTTKKPYHSSGEELLRHMGIGGGLNDNEPSSIKDGDQIDSQEKLKKRRGRPRKVGIKSSITLPSEEPSKDAIASELLVKDFITSDNDSLKDVEVKSGNIDFSVPSEEFVINGSSKKQFGEQEKHKNKSNMSALSQLRKLSDAAVEVSIKQQEKHSLKRGRRRTINVNVVSQVQDSPHASVGKTAESNCMPREVEITSEELPAKTFEDQPLSKWFQEMHSPTINGASRVSPATNVEQCAMASNGQLRSVEERTAVDKTKIVGYELESLPFVKNNLLWSTLESMEVFQKLPQKPHFRPLEQYKESSREGLAIGYMVNFSSVVERTSKLQFDDPKSTLDDVLETLLELEGHGFDVEVVRDRITDLLNMKEKKEKLEEQLEEFQGEIEKQKVEKDKIDEEMDEMKKQILVLQEKLSQAKSAKESKDVEIASLESKLEGIKEGMGRMESDFQRLATSLR